jgi:hypothetical protein
MSKKQIVAGFALIIVFGFLGWKITNHVSHHDRCVTSEGKIIHMSYDPSYKYIDYKGAPPFITEFDSVVPEKYMFTIKGVCGGDTIEEKIIVDSMVFKKHCIGDNFKFNLK